MVTRSVLHVGPGGPGVPPHTHDGSEIEGTADLIHLRVDQLLAGTITGKEITVAGGAAGVIRSDNFASGVDGWAIFGDGSAELNDVVVRGTIVAGTGSEVDWSYIKNVSIENADIVSLEFDKITAGSNDASLVIGASGSIASANYAPGTAGFIIEGTGDAEFNDVTVRGAVIAGAGSSIDWGYIDNVSIGSADITDLSFDKITAATNDASLVIGAAGSISSANYAAGSAGVYIGGDGTLEANDGTFRGTIHASAGSFSGTLALGGVINFTSGGIIRTASSGRRVEIVATTTGVTTIDYYNAVGAVFGRLYSDTSMGNNLSLSSTLGALELRGETTLSLIAGGGSNVTVLDLNQMRLGTNGSAAAPALAFDSAPDTGLAYSEGANQLSVVVGGSQRAVFGSSGYLNFAVRDNTTGAAANVVINSTTGQMERSTSARKYKSRITYNVDYLADIELRPTKFYRKDDHSWFFGFIADDLADQHPLLATYDDTGEVENYDQRAVLAVLAAKVNRLEAEIARLKEAA